MDREKLSQAETILLRELNQHGTLKVARRENASRSDLASDLEQRGLVRTVRTEAAGEDSCYIVLTGRGVITLETAA